MFLGDTRESAAIYISRHLLEEGAYLSIYDPKVICQIMIIRYIIGPPEKGPISPSTTLRYIKGPLGLVEGPICPSMNLRYIIGPLKKGVNLYNVHL